MLYYDQNVRNTTIIIFVGIAMLSFLLTLIFLCRKKWRSKAKTSLAITLSCIICTLMSVYIYIPNNPEKKAERTVTKFIKEYNNENTENELKLISLYADSISLSPCKYSYIAEAQLNETNNSNVRNIYLYVNISGEANESCWIIPSGLSHYGFSDTEIELMKLGGCFSSNRVTDQDLWNMSDDNRAKYNIYYEGLKNIAAYKINQALNISSNGYYQDNNLKIELTIKNPIITLKNPYVLVILDNGNITKTFKTNTIIRKGEFGNISLNLGEIDAKHFEIKILANEVFSDVWLKDYLLTMNWSGKEFHGIYVDGIVVKELSSKGVVEKDKMKNTYDLYYYIEQFNL